MLGVNSSHNLLGRRVCSLASTAFIFWLLTVPHALPVLHAQDSKTATWTDASGAFKIEASFVQLDGNSVVLKNSQGKVIKVPLEKLSLASQLQARKLANPKAFERPATPTPPAVPAAAIGPTFELGASPYPSNPTIEQFLDITLRELKANQPKVLWHAMPKSMQQELDAIVVKGVSVLGEPVLKQFASIMKSVGKLVREKKQFILAHPQVVSQGQAELAELEASWPTLVSLTDSITDPSVWSVSNFQPRKVGPWIAGLATAMINPLIEISNKAAAQHAKKATGAEVPVMSLDAVSYKIVRQSAGQAVVVVFNPQGKPSPEFEMRQVEGTWLPAPIADNWRDALAQAKSNLEGLTPEQVSQMRTGTTLGLATVGGMVGSLANAATQEQFNQAVEQVSSFIPQPNAPLGPGGPISPSIRPGRKGVQ